MKIGQVDQEPYYKPFIGARYAEKLAYLRGRDGWPPSGLSHRVHVLGESHYVDIDQSFKNRPDLTLNVVEEWAFVPRQGRQFFTKILQAISNSPFSENAHREGMAEIAFSNYIQSPLPAARIKPAREQWTEASRSFAGQLDITRPTILFVLGQRLWHNLPEHFGGAYRKPSCMRLRRRNRRKRPLGLSVLQQRR